MARRSLRIDATRAIKKTNIFEKLLDKNSLELTKAHARNSVRYAKRMAPSYSGDTRKAIQSRTVKLSDGYRTRIFSPNRSGRSDFNLPEWMHVNDGFRSGYEGRGKGGRWIRTGSPTYLYDTADYMRKQKRNLVQKYWGTIKVK